MNQRVKLGALYMGSFAVSVAPLVTVLSMKWDSYTETPSDTVKLCIGGIIVVALIFLKVIGRLKIPKTFVLFAAIFAIAYLLEKVIADIVMLSGLALAGEGADVILFKRAIKNTKEKIHIGKTADATAEKVKEIMDSYFGGRV